MEGNKSLAEWAEITELDRIRDRSQAEQIIGAEKQRVHSDTVRYKNEVVVYEAKVQACKDAAEVETSVSRPFWERFVR